MSDTLIDINSESFVARLISGDEGAFDKLFDQMYPRLCRYISINYEQIDPRDAEEIALDVMKSVANSISRFIPGKAKLTTWIVEITKNKVKDFLRRRKLKIKRDALADPRFIDSSEDTAGQEALNRETIRTSNPISGIEDTDKPDETLIWEIYNSLSKEEQEILSLRVIKEMTYDEISKSTGVAVNTLMVRCSRAKRKLAHGLKDEMSERRKDS